MSTAAAPNPGSNVVPFDPAKSFDPSTTYRDMLYPRISRLLYNPGDEPIEFSVGGETMVVPPRDIYAPKRAWGLREEQSYQEARGCLPGVLPMRDRYLNKKVVGSQGNVIYEIMPAAEQVAMSCVLGPDGTSGFIAKMGVRLLSGNPEIDALIMADALQAWEKNTELTDLVLIRTHEQINRKRAEHQIPPDRPSPRVRKAYERRSIREAQGRASRLFDCQTCGEGHTAVEDRDRHIVTMHPEVARAMGLGTGTAFTTSGDLKQVDVGAAYARGVTGAAAGYKEVVIENGKRTERWVGESPADAEARLAQRQYVQHGAVEAAVQEVVAPLLSQMAALQVQLEEMQEKKGAAALATAKANEDVPQQLSQGAQGEGDKAPKGTRRKRTVEE